MHDSCSGRTTDALNAEPEQTNNNIINPAPWHVDEQSEQDMEATNTHEPNMYNTM